MRWAAIVLAGLAITGPARAEVLHVAGVFGANARAASLLPTIGIGPFDGAYGGTLADAIERRLSKLGADGVPHAVLVPAGLRPDGLLSGHTGVNVSTNDYTESRERCVEKNKDGKCVAKQRYQVRCTNRTIDVRADLVLREARSGEKPYDTTKTRHDFSSWCEDRGVASDVGFTVGSMADSIAQEVRLDLAPHAEDYKVRVREERDGLPPDIAKQFKTAVHLTKSDEHAACDAFAAIDKAVPDQGSTTFNLALCAEAAGRYAEAADRYTRARLFAPDAGSAVSKGLERVASLAAGRDDVAIMRARPPVRGTGF